MSISMWDAYKFGPSNVNGSPGGTVTWAVDSTVPAFFVPTLKTAFTTWSTYADIQFKQVDISASPLITISTGSIDGKGGTISKFNVKYTQSSVFLPGSVTSESIIFDSAENWHVSGKDIVTDGGTTLLTAALNETGYAIGLQANYFDPTSIVSKSAFGAGKTLGKSDIKDAQTIYGEVTKYWYLVDQDYYYSNNPDVASSPFSPIEHYNSSGWQEGRNPDAYFSTAGYLAANVDVYQSRANPLDHYDRFGWKEGRDPSANFDNELYLLHNPDVKAAGIDPLLHYLHNGKAEGRKAYDAIGQASSFSHGSFDAEYYLLANPDVAKAALDAGNDTFSFAYRHFENNGWKEGRKANAFFDPAYYLAKNPDVAAAHIDPLNHYDTYGWKEGRNPSATFDTAAYLTANPDVASAHIDPLLHYLQYGALEGRNLA